MKLKILSLSQNLNISNSKSKLHSPYKSELNITIYVGIIYYDLSNNTLCAIF